IVLETAKIAGVFLVLWITGQSTSYANMARLMATETQNVGKFAKFLKALGYLAIAVSIGLTWYVGIRSAMDAEFGWQKANAISDMAGMTMAIIFIAAIAFIPVFGQLIAAVLMLLDGIAALACNGLSDKQKRSTAAQWLCGGITGILANIFTPYKSNLVIDPDDPWSYTKQLTSDGAALESQPLGFRQGNGLRMSMSATDYIERMPFPATWMALPYFWQWNGEDERKASFNYALGNTQQEMASQISTGSQYGLWNRNTSYRDGDKTYTYTKTSSFVFVNKFVQTGINRTMRDVILSQGKKVPQQTCFMIWIVFFPLPVCFIQTHADNDATNLNESEKTVFDIMPATITEFVSLRAQDDGYTFGWSPADANPAFPVFADADNDGLAKDLERSNGGADNTYDTDSDGVADRFEVARRTKLNKADSDDDGLNDSAEIIYNTNPLAADTDGDGLTDSEEIVRMVDGRRTGGWEVVYAIVNGVPQTTWVGSDPTQADGDADGIIDFREKILGWSPYAKNSGEIMGIAGTVREGIVPTVKVDFERGTPSGFPNTGYTAGALTCDGACPTVTYPTIPFVPVSPGSFNTAVRFDGARSVLVNPGAARAFSSAFTVAAALKPNTTSIWAWSRVMMAQSGQFSIIQWFDSVQVYLSTSNGIVALLIPGALDANAWRHLAVTYDGEVVTGYIDGVEKARTRAPGALIDTDATKNSITVGALPGSNGWQGELDNLAVFAVALRPSEIRDLRSERLSTVNDLVVRPGERIVATTTLTNKLLGRSLQGYTTVAPLAAVNTVADGVTMMGAYGPNAANTQDTVFTVPGNTTGTATVASCPLGVTVVCAKFDETTRTAGVMRFLDVATYGSALQCDGICPSLRDGAWSFETNAQIRTSADAGNALGSHDFTAALWVKPEGQATVTRPLVHAASGGLRLELLNERPQFVYDGAVLTAPSALPIGSWSHLLFRMRDGIRSISVNGVPVVADRTTIRYAGGFGQLYIGASVDGRSLALAALRDLQIYQRALDDAEITAVAATCDDGLLIACAGYTGSLSDQSRHGIQQLVTWSCTGCSATAGVAGIAGSALLLASDGLRLPDGYAALLSNHDFTVSQAVQVSSASQPVFTTGAATTGGNQLRVFVDGGTATATLGGVTVTAGTVNAGAWYVFSVRQKSGVLTLSVHGLSGSTVTTTRGVATAPLLQRAQAPLQFGASGSKIDAARVYRSAVDDRTLDAVARLLLRGNSELRVNQAPVSETVDIAVDTRNKVVNPDPNFERLAGACDGALAAVCLPFIAAYPSEYASVVRGKTVTQSSNYQNAYPATNAIDNNRGTFNHTLYDNKPYWQIDLGSSQDIRSVTVFPRNDCCGERIVNAMVFLTDTDLGDSRDIAANKTATVRAYDGSQAWKMMNCNTQSACALGWAERRDVTFAAGTRARYVRIQLDATQYLHLAEVRVNNKPIDPCDDTASCPVLTEGGADFSGAKYIAIDPPTSAAAFEGSAANFTVMGWFKFKNVDGDQLILQDVGPYGTNSGLHLLVRGRKLMMAYYNNDIVGATTLTPGVWYHVAFVKDGAKRTIYLNGQVDMTQAAGGYLTDVRQLTIGRTLNATVRDFQILKTAVSAAELSRTYAAPSLNLEFPFDEPATTLQYGDVLTSGLRLVCETFCPLSGIPGRDDRGVRLDGKRVLTGDANTRT
ncbi:MAG: hypothetical protein RLZZ297_1402, partial [Chloroflexota bacterium]